MKENGELPGGQVPIYIDEKGRVFNQTGAVLIMLGKQNGYYPKDAYAAYEDDWAISNFGDIWTREFYTLWFKDEIDDDLISGACDKFEPWNQVVEAKLNTLGNFIGGEKPSIGDFITFSVYANFILNQDTKVANLRNALRAEMASTPNVQAWVKRM